MAENELIVAGVDDPIQEVATELLTKGIEEAKAIAQQFGYAGSVRPEVLVESIKQSAARINSEMIQVGLYFKMLKAQCSHGNFVAAVEESGFSVRVAQKYMLVVDSFSNTKALSFLPELGKTKAFMIAESLDSAEIERLVIDGEINGVVLDDVRAMTTRELKEALAAKDKEIADAKANYEARGKVLENKQKQIDDMAEKLAKKEQADLAQPEDAREKLLRAELTSKAMDVQSLIMVTIKDGIEQLLIEGEKTNTDHRPFLSALMSELLSKITHVQEAFVLYDSFEQEPWMIEDIDQAREAVEASVDAAMTRETGV